MTIKIVTKEELGALAKAVLEDKHFEVLHIAYLRYRKRKFTNYNWIAEAILQDYKISIPVKTYATIRQIQSELAKLPFDEIRPFVIYVLELFKRESERHLSKTKYTSIWNLAQAMDRYNLQTRLGEDHMEPSRPKRVTKTEAAPKAKPKAKKVASKAAPKAKKVAPKAKPKATPKKVVKKPASKKAK